MTVLWQSNKKGKEKCAKWAEHSVMHPEWVEAALGVVRLSLFCKCFFEWDAKGEL